jgi:hypothetical protein
MGDDEYHQQVSPVSFDDVALNTLMMFSLSSS